MEEEIVITAVVNRPQDSKLSYKYWTKHVLDENDSLFAPSVGNVIRNERGRTSVIFYDIGRPRQISENMKLTPLEELKKEAVDQDREKILVNLVDDKPLHEFLEKQVSDTRSLGSLEEKVKRISENVDRRLSGNRSSNISLLNIKNETDKHIHRLKNCENSNVIKLGSLEYGLCRHRSLLFKVVCDYLGEIKCRLIRGDFVYGKDRRPQAHCWNVVLLPGGEEYGTTVERVCDVMHSPGQILDVRDSEDYHKRYQRIAYDENFSQIARGAGLSSIPVAQLPDWYISPQKLVACLINHPQGEELPKLGDGSFGIVYKAEYNQETVAVKVPKEEAGRIAISQFRNEWKSLVTLKHENIVTFKGACDDPKNEFMVTEHMKGGDLFAKLHPKGQSANHSEVIKLSPKEFCSRLRIAFQIAKGMNHLHQMGMIHGDLKSGNVLLTESLVAKLADFGLTKMNTAAETTSLTGMSRAYAAPELFEMESSTQNRKAVQPYNEKTDVYSFGIILAELFTSKIPKSPQRRLGASFTRQINPELLPEDLPEKLKLLIKNCLSLDKGQRPNAGEIVKILEDIHDYETRPAKRKLFALEEDLKEVELELEDAKKKKVVLTKEEEDLQKKKEVLTKEREDLQRRKLELQKEVTQIEDSLEDNVQNNKQCDDKIKEAEEKIQKMQAKLNRDKTAKRSRNEAGWHPIYRAF
ncbi:hypothetical protein CYMTET_30138 [Cymbomonas tetramitiformis]|uniref:Protein kinase domain-containing protein n=1 Tax=Cymbomonas tetramitiformis TaxID=36881 RepID=A0AAE0BYL8_9CHLO|nr:hypothetical protein CYMTET_45828 [Cymbomonas tetramitiformis]KAK3260931.1 hypothetical protein CYMTET_30138 [Cymbomonas tetramitiformis]